MRLNNIKKVFLASAALLSAMSMSAADRFVSFQQGDLLINGNDKVEIYMDANDCRGVTYVRQVIANLAPALSLPGGVYNFGSSNTENMVHTAQQFAQELDIAVQIEAADWPRNLVMDGKKLEKAGIRFDTTQQGIRHCLRDYGLASR